MITQPARAANASQPATAEPWRGEERLVREAILLVASRGAPRVLVAGLTWGEQVLDACRRPALEAGARLHARPTANPERLDVLVEAIR